tara:strand:+ start:495 stop:716 length:222 start_codon:yes stop_codon:yes gene_type:complete
MTINTVVDILQRIEKKVENHYHDRWLSLNEIVKYTSLSQSTIRRAVRKGVLKASSSTGKLLFKISDVDKWLGK